MNLADLQSKTPEELAQMVLGLIEDIESAPHGVGCNVYSQIIGQPKMDCTCFKSRAITRAQRTLEREGGMSELSGIAKYCLVFLWNGGEMVRAVGLCRELTGESLAQSRRIVTDLVANYGKDQRARAIADRQLRDRLNAENPSDIPV